MANAKITADGTKMEHIFHQRQIGWAQSTVRYFVAAGVDDAPLYAIFFGTAKRTARLQVFKLSSGA